MPNVKIGCRAFASNENERNGQHSVSNEITVAAKSGFQKSEHAEYISVFSRFYLGCLILEHMENFNLSLLKCFFV